MVSGSIADCLGKIICMANPMLKKKGTNLIQTKRR